MLDWLEWSTRNSMRTRIRRKVISNIGNSSASFLHCIIVLLHPNLHILVLHRACIDPASSRFANFENGSCLHEIPHPRNFRVWVSAEYTEVPADAKYCISTGDFLSRSICYSHRHCVCLGPLDSAWFRGSSFGGFNFFVVISSCVGHLRDFFKAMQEFMGRNFVRVIQLHLH